MIGNSDIFDQEELLAIANDSDGSSSPSCHSSASGSGSDEENSSPIVSTKAEEEIDSVSSERKEETVPNNSRAGVAGCAKTADALTKNDKQTEYPPSNSQSQTAPIAKDRGEENGSLSSDDDSDDDGGFLESWFESEKKVSVAQSTLEKSTHDSIHEDEDIVEMVETQKKDELETESADGGEENIEQQNEKNRIELGASVLQWVSSAKKSEGKKKRSQSSLHDNRGVVALQHNHDEQDFISPTSMLRLTTTSLGNPRKRPRAGAECAEATLEEISSSERMVKCGKAAYASDNAGNILAPGAMVDCLARYDFEKGCYVLEIVDLLVNKLEPSSKAAQDEQIVHQGKAATIANATSNKCFDPRSRAKRADDQIKKLKKGKGRAGPLKKRKQKQSDGLSAENKK